MSADGNNRDERLSRARKLYLADPEFRELTKEILADLLKRRPYVIENFAQEALVDAIDEWEYEEPEQPYHEYLYEQTPEGHRLGH